MDREIGRFVWNIEKEISNIKKHGVSFEYAMEVFRDMNRRILADKAHSAFEARFFAIGEVNGRLLTVRFTYRQDKIRIIGAGFWRMGGMYYYEEEKI